MMNETTTMPTYATKTASEVPFKNELYGKECSWELIKAANHKTYRQFIRDCKNPDHLLEVMLLKAQDPHFPKVAQISKIHNRATFWGYFIYLVAGTKNANALKCAIYRNHIPKQQYATV